MSTFEFVFSLFGLLLGLGLAEVLGGFSRAWKARRVARIGWLTPMLGLLVTLDLTSFWILAWSLRDAFVVRYWVLLVVLFYTGLYYLAATLIFPEDATGTRDYDTHYSENKRWVMGAMLLVNVPNYVHDALTKHVFTSDAVGVVTALAFVVLAVAMLFVRSVRADTVLLGLLIALYPIGAIHGAFS